MAKHDLSRRKFLGAAGAAMSAGLTAAERSAAAAEAESTPAKGCKPNLILFMPDELRADALACFGNEICRTPNLDKLASEGTKFTQCHVQYPVCGASRCSLLTGWPASVRGHRSLYYFLRPEEPNLFRYLKQAGYDVFVYGKNDALSAEVCCESLTEWNYPPLESSRGSAGFPWEPPWKMDDPHYYSFLYNEGGDRRAYPDYHNLQMAFRILERTQAERPFCIFLPLLSPHPPYRAPQGFHDLYKPTDLPALRPIGLPRRPNFHAGIRDAYHLGPLPESVFRQIRAVYLGMVTYTDWLLGELLETVERTGHAGDTAILVFSDHGDYAGDYGLVEKWPSGLEDALTHVPVIARVPGGARNHSCENMVEVFDVMATCLELAGVEARHTHFARSLLPQIHGGAGDAERAAFCEGGYNDYEPQCFEPPRPLGDIYYPKTHLQLAQPEMITRSAMVRTHTHKLILRPDGQSELYAYQQDPQELHNLFGDSSTTRAQNELMQRLAAWYLTTTGIAPFDKDQRDFPPFIPTPEFTK